jgi:glutamate dehydrogenase (NAD(P)+)
MLQLNFCELASCDYDEDANAGKLDCKLVIEAANGPTTPEGDKILRERGITVLPGQQQQ